MNSWVPKWLVSVSSRHRPKRRGLLAARSDAIAPRRYLSAEATARPANDDGPELADVLDQGAADAVNIRDLRLGPDPDAVIDDSADVLGKLTVAGGRPDRADRLVEKNRDRELRSHHFHVPQRRGTATAAVVAPAIANRLTAVRREISFKSFGGSAFEIFMVTVPSQLWRLLWSRLVPCPNGFPVSKISLADRLCIELL